MGIKLLFLPGDGIGPEIAAATKSVLLAVDRKFGLGLQLIERDVGFAALERTGTTLPEELFELAKDCDGTVLGPVSTADYPPPEEGGQNPSAGFRKRLNLFANIRPSRARAGTSSLAPDIDLVVVRENTEGFYADRTMHLGNGEFMPTPDLAMSMRKITRQGSENIGRAACELALQRRKKLTIVTKTNVLKITDGLFRDCVLSVAEDFPGLEVEEVLVDAAAAHLVRTPGAFDVIVTTNMFGDILSDLCAELSGGLGLGGSINAGSDAAVAQAAHGSAPDIAGRNSANPTALMISAAMLLDWIGRRSGENAPVEAAAEIERVLDMHLGDDATRTTDLGGTLTTNAFGEKVSEAISQS